MSEIKKCVYCDNLVIEKNAFGELYRCKKYNKYIKMSDALTGKNCLLGFTKKKDKDVY